MKQGDHLRGHAVCHVPTDEGSDGVSPASVNRKNRQCPVMVKNADKWLLGLASDGNILHLYKKKEILLTEKKRS